MKIEFHGAARTVTGSCHLLTVGDKRILVDCGMFQGGRKLEARNEMPFPFSPRSIDAVLVTHSHVDHVGLLPKLVQQGYYGPIICTRAAADMTELILRDAAHIQESEAEWHNRKAKRAGGPMIKPLYTMEDAEAAIELIQSTDYHQMTRVVDNVKAVFKDAGHILGSAIIEVYATENGSSRKIVFSGDLGNTEQAIIRDPETVQEADFVLIESTYGNRNHRNREDTLNELAEILIQAYKDEGNVVIPAFAVGRTQELLYQLRRLSQEGRLPNFRVFVDSPMAISATNIYRKHGECFDAETMQLIMDGEGPFHLDRIEYTQLTEQSRAINFVKEPSLIISASGMCSAGRILHHLKHNLWRRSSHIVFVGYQAHGSLGRIIIEGEPRVKIFGEEIACVAHIHTLGGLSAHADQKILLNWLESVAPCKPGVFVVHGEEQSSAAFAKKIKSDLGLPDVFIPTWHEEFQL